MSRNGTARYPVHLARLVAARLREREIEPPPDKVLSRLFETLYFASLKTDEGRHCVCTVNYVHPQKDVACAEDRVGGWWVIRFRPPLPLTVGTLNKVAEAADPVSSSLAVTTSPEGELLIWGLVDQELRHGDYVSLDAKSSPQRPGMFQVAVTGVGNLSVFKDYELLGSLEQNQLVADYHDVLWEGPVHQRLKDNLRSTLAITPSPSEDALQSGEIVQVKDELLIRWQNALCRMLMNIQQYKHGGGLLIVPQCPADNVHVKYQIRYDRLPRALFGLARHQFLKRQTSDRVAQHCRTPTDVLPCNLHFNAVEYQKKLSEYKSEAVGCTRFIASLSRVDGFVLLDRSLIVHGFGVEARAECDLSDVYIASDAKASPRLLRQGALSQFGTRHRAMMRYCQQHDGALGFVISQDGDIRATMRVKDRLLLWENINVQIGFRSENRVAQVTSIEPVTGLFRYWSRSLANLRSA